MNRSLLIAILVVGIVVAVALRIIWPSSGNEIEEPITPEQQQMMQMMPGGQQQVPQLMPPQQQGGN